MNKDDKIYIAGHRGMVGSAIWRRLEAEGYTNLIGRTSRELDLTNQEAVETFFAENRPDYVFLAAAKVGGIKANNDYPAEFIHQNLAIQTNVIHNAWKFGTTKLAFLGSSCIYPRDCPQPIKEESLLTGPLEPTNQPYAIAKIAGIEMCKSYRRQYGFDAISLMPTNLYGPGDNFDLETSHVLPALIRKFHEAKERGDPEVEIWGTGTPRREFLHVDDLADASLHLMRRYSALEHINVGVGTDISICELAEQILDVVGYQGELRFNTEKPDGTPLKLLDVSRLRDFGWAAGITLDNGISDTYQGYQLRSKGDGSRLQPDSSNQ
ncbi:GDP-L-fucose synthase family protein [Halofilum ochraceum]|uniref:GDP-L-fucose synthase family protein n=1 Tax=Halofilum ochraceum TaxID=1611323 RepID=UPI0008D9CA12|nr:GDP-L-fucose synthase [Halofilum ochraceum]